eukprot:359362-Chlamydomonas_euryale.AAC.8
MLAWAPACGLLARVAVCALHPGMWPTAGAWQDLRRRRVSGGGGFGDKGGLDQEQSLKAMCTLPAVLWSCC